MMAIKNIFSVVLRSKGVFINKEKQPINGRVGQKGVGSSLY